MKEDIVKQQYSSSLKVEEKIIIMKELPRKMVQDRKVFKKLTVKLKQKDIRFRWEIPQGMSFTYREVTRTITTINQMGQFLADYVEDFE